MIIIDCIFRYINVRGIFDFIYSIYICANNIINNKNIFCILCSRLKSTQLKVN